MVIAESQSIHSPLRSRRVRPRSVQVREASGNDYPAIVARESRYALQTKSYDEWTHLWDANPVYQEIGAEWQRGWVLETRDAGPGTVNISDCEPKTLAQSIAYIKQISRSVRATRS